MQRLRRQLQAEGLRAKVIYSGEYGGMLAWLQHVRVMGDASYMDL